MSEIDTQNNSAISSETIETEVVPSENDRPWLKSWKPGQSGNPGGRPKTKEARAAILKHLHTVLSKGAFAGQERIMEAVDRLYWEDLRTYFAYAYGKPVETHLLASMDVEGQGMLAIDVAIAREAAKELLLK